MYAIVTVYLDGHNDAFFVWGIEHEAVEKYRARVMEIMHIAHNLPEGSNEAITPTVVELYDLTNMAPMKESSI